MKQPLLLSLLVISSLQALSPVDKELFDAIDEGSPGKVEKALAKGAYTNSYTVVNPPLILALSHNDIAITELLLNHNPNLITIEPDESPLVYAIKYNCSKELIHLLLQKGSMYDQRSLGAALHKVLQSFYKGDKEAVVKLLLAYGAQSTAKDLSGETTYQVAQRLQETAIIEIFDNAQAIKRQFSEEASLLTLSFAGDLDGVKLCVERGDNINELSMFTPLIAAAANEFNDVCAYLLNHGADPNIISDYGTALHLAVRDNNQELIDLLIEHGADLSLRDQDGKTPIDYYDIRKAKLPWATISSS